MVAVELQPPTPTRPTTRSESTPTIMLPSMPASINASASGAPKFKPATDNFAVPSVTAPLANHHVSADSSKDVEPTAESKTNDPPALVREPEATSAMMPRVPANTYAVDVLPAVDFIPEREKSHLPPKNVSAATDVDTTQPEDLEPKIESLTDRLEELVSNAGDSGVAEEETAQAEIVADPVTPVAEEDEASPQIDVDVLSVAIPPMTPQANSDSATSDPQPEAKDESADRRSALEQYFANSGISLTPSEPANETETESPSFSPVSSPEPAEAVSPVPTPDTVSEPVAETPTPVEAVETPVVDEEKSETSDAFEKTESDKPAFDIDSLLATLEMPSGTTPTETPETLPEPSVEMMTGRTDSQAVEDAFSSMGSTEPSVVAETVDVDLEAEPVAAEEFNADSDDSADNTDQENGNSQMKSFELLQSLGLDTSELSKIKDEITAPATSEPTEANAFANDDQQEIQLESTSELAESEVVDTSQPPVEQESVADVLARMKLAGSLSDLEVPEAKSAVPEMVEPVAPPEAPAPTITPEVARLRKWVATTRTPLKITCQNCLAACVAKASQQSPNLPQKNRLKNLPNLWSKAPR